MSDNVIGGNRATTRVGVVSKSWPWLGEAVKLVSLTGTEKCLKSGGGGRNPVNKTSMPTVLMVVASMG